MNIILASASPRRKELLESILSDFDIIVSDVEEKVNGYLSPEETAKELAYLKAKNVFDRTSGNRIVIGCDTIVAKGNKIYGKPQSRSEAIDMLHELLDGDRTHNVISGLTVLAEKEGKLSEYKIIDKSTVHLMPMTDDEINKWIDTGNAADKAGAYAIQQEFRIFVEKIEGNYDSIVGLPTSKLYDILKKCV